MPSFPRYSSLAIQLHAAAGIIFYSCKAIVIVSASPDELLLHAILLLLDFLRRIKYTNGI